MKKISTFLVLFLTVPFITAAHATVAPFQAPTQSYQDFSVSVPTEKEMATVGVRLLMPVELSKVTPFVKQGWKITVTKVGETVTQIEWTGGKIPHGQKDIFQFTSKTPATSTTMIWKVYQTYEDGTVVAWDRDPKTPAEEEEKVKNPYSTTEVRADVLPAGLPQKKEPAKSFDMFGIIALGLSAAALALALRRSRDIRYTASYR
jgi:uncharacterized protein YcnI